MAQNNEAILYQIRDCLLANTNIKKLLFYNTPDALSKKEPSTEEAKPYIELKPLIMLKSDNLSINKANFISISAVEISYEDVDAITLYRLSIVIDMDNWELNDNRLRALSILNEVEKELRYKKFKAVGNIILDRATETYFNKSLMGYILLFGVSDESKRTTEF